MKPYMKQGLLTEDPIDGTFPPKHRSQKKGARQEAKKELRDENHAYERPPSGVR